MKYVHLFSYNVPADNHDVGRTDFYVHALAEWNGDSFWNNGTPMIYVNAVNLSFYDCISVKNWNIVYADIKRIAQEHFAELARMEKINQARAILAVELPENPILARYEADLPTQQTLL